MFAPNSGCVARYAPFIRDKSPEIHGAGYRIRYFCKDFNPASV
ncbi:MAG: hypothetical protein E6357_22210 [Clostridiales bacterium]|nr:hypothetical protein [Clostridiales bacterium]